MTSVRGEGLLAETFPENLAKSNVVLVVARPNGRLTDDDKAVALRLAETFTPKEGETSPVLSVLTHEKEIIGQKLISRKSDDGQAVLVVLQLSTELMAVDNMPFIKGIYDKVRDVQKEPDFPAGLQLGVTGSAPIGTDMLNSQKESIENTEFTTILLVIVILLIVYRARGWCWCRWCRSAYPSLPRSA